ncbi:hypothetical protein EG329_009900 [Mollisiaceae sp. DMI_Dod_QoI]|nr:hypothetical protein EG329_009900 [Helotiales sp. DMI_Dod_QoI]
MAETHILTSHSPNGPTHLSASSPPTDNQDEGGEAQASPPNTNEDSEHKLPIDVYCKQGSLWAMPMHERTVVFEQNQNPMHILECWEYDAMSESPLSPITEFKEIKEDEIEAWVSAETPTKEGLKPVAGYKILQMDSPPEDIFPLSSKTYQALIESFKLPAVELHMGSREQGACGVFREDDGSFLLVNRRPNIRVTVSTILRFDPLTNITSGYIVTDNGYFDIPSFDFSFLPTQFLACSHPILLPILFIEQTLYTRVGDIGLVVKGLDNIEQVTGFTSNVAKMTEDLGLQDIVRMLGEQHAYYATIETSLLAFKLTIATFKRELDYMNSESLPAVVQGRLLKHTRKLRDRIKYLESTLEHTLLDGNIKTRLQAQQQVVFNLIAQADTKVNISLAKDSKEIAAASKQDSSAMKIIAMLTTLFLPGTFIATLFAMPLFDWQQPSIHHVANQYFWVYWAVTGPLTLATMALVISWAYWHRSHLRAEVWRATKDIDGGKPADDSQSNEEERSDPGNSRDSAELVERERQEKWFSKAILRRRQIWRKGNIKKQDDPESLEDQ